MDRFLTLSAENRARAFQQAGTDSGWPAESVEKDFWVCVMLKELYALPRYGNHLIFKGGTSLSKAWGLIDRFSEDVDLTLDRNALGFGGNQAPEAGASRNEQRRRLDNLASTCSHEIQEVIAPALRHRLAALIPAAEQWSLQPDNDDTDRQTLLFEYPQSHDSGTTAYLKRAIKLEFGARSDPWPAEARTITPIVGEVLGHLFDESSCGVQALQPERTFWEKILLLHEERSRPTGRPPRARMARHYYDVWCLIEKGVAARAVADSDLFDRVVQHRAVYFRQNWVDYETIRRGALQLLPASSQEAAWRTDYRAMQGACS